jgi:hypothetical protein
VARLPEETSLLDLISEELSKLGSLLDEDECDALIARARVIPNTLLARYPTGQGHDPVVWRSHVGALISSVVHVAFSSRGKSMELLPERAALIRERVEAIPYINALL